MRSARRHHYLPVFLLKQFRIASDFDAIRVTALRRDRAFEVSVHDIGIEKNFHSGSGFFSNPEYELSKWEGEFNADLSCWKNGPLDDKGRATADRLICHLRTRSKIFRTLGTDLLRKVLSSSEQAIAAAIEQSKPERGLRDELLRLVDEIGEECAKGPLKEDARLAFVDQHARRILARHAVYWAVTDAAKLTKAVMTDQLLKELSSGIHTTVLLSALFNHRKHAAFGDCYWSVMQSDGQLILGDIGPLVKYVGIRRLKPLYMESAAMQAIYLPIGPRKVLVGSCTRRNRLPTASTLNLASVCLSHEFVVAAMAKKRLEKYRQFLATRATEDSAERIFGTDTPDSSDLINQIRNALVEWTAGRVDQFWTHTLTPSQ